MIINNLHIKKLEIDYVKNIFIVYTLDQNVYKKNYYLEFNELKSDILKNQIVQVCEYGHKYKK